MYKPPWQLPSAFGTDEPFPNVIQGPPAVQLTVSASQPWLDTMGPAAVNVADAIVDAYSTNISQFVQAQRQRRGLGGIEYTRHQFTVAGLTVDYFNNQGQETIRLTVFPESSTLPGLTGLTPALNFDGYVAWVHSWQQLPAPAVDNAPVDIVLNGFGVVTNYTPPDNQLRVYQPALDPNPPAAVISQATVIIVVAFGTTALRCASLQDAANLNAFVKQPLSGGLTHPILPPRKVIPASNNVPEHKDLLGYFLFNWGDRLNPDAWAYNGNQGTGPNFTYDANFPPATIIKIIQFKDPLHSPLVANGLNKFYAQYASTPAAGTGQNGVDFLCAEFYNRKSIRPAIQSWTGVLNGSVYLVNDEPLYFATDGGNPFSDIGARTNFELDFDLTPAVSPSGACTFGDFSTTQFILVPLTAAQTAVEQANLAAAIAHGAAYNAALATLTTAQQNSATANGNIQTIVHSSALIVGYAYVENPTPANYSAFIAVETDPTFQVLYINYCKASVAFQQNPSSTAIQAAFAAAENAFGSDAFVVAGDALGIIASAGAYAYSAAYPNAYNQAIAANKTVTAAIAAGTTALASSLSAFTSQENALIAFANSQARPSLGTAAQTAFNALVVAENAFVATLQVYQPAAIQSDNYKPIDSFNYRTITVSGDSYEIGPWSQG